MSFFNTSIVATYDNVTNDISSSFDDSVLSEQSLMTMLNNNSVYDMYTGNVVTTLF